MTMGSLPCALSSVRSKCELKSVYSSSNVLQPSRVPLTAILISTVGLVAAAMSACSAVLPVVVQRIAFTPADWKRYSKSWESSWFVAGIAIAPSLCNASIAIQN